MLPLLVAVSACIMIPQTAHILESTCMTAFTNSLMSAQLPCLLYYCLARAASNILEVLWQQAKRRKQNVPPCPWLLDLVWSRINWQKLLSGYFKSFQFLSEENCWYASLGLHVVKKGALTKPTALWMTCRTRECKFPHVVQSRCHSDACITCNMSRVVLQHIAWEGGSRAWQLLPTYSTHAGMKASCLVLPRDS